MSTVKKRVEKTVVEEVSVRVSDISGREIPKLHWSAVTNIKCIKSDHGHWGGNQGVEFELEMLPEEMARFRDRLRRLIQEERDYWKVFTTKGGA